MSRSTCLWAIGALLSPMPMSAQAAPDSGLVGVYRRATLEMELRVGDRYRILEAGAPLVDGHFHASGDTLAVVDETGPVACPAGITGRYLARPSPDSLTLITVQELCSGRLHALAGGPWSRVRPESPVALLHATVIDGTGASPEPDLTLVLAGGRIADLFPSVAKSPPAGAQVLDLTGRYVIPGLIDTHVHLATDPSGGDRRDVEERVLRTALHGGVTSVRDMAGDGRRLADLARAALVGDIESPAIYYAAVMAGPKFFADPRVRLASRGVTPGTAPWARAVTAATTWPMTIAEAKGTGATGIKVYAAVSAAVLRPLVAEAHRQGLKVWAHAAPFPARPRDVVEAGVDVVSHVDLLAAQLMPPHDRFPRMPNFAELRADDPRIGALLHLMARRGTLFDATLFIEVNRPGLPDDRRHDLAAWCAAVVHAAWAAGVPITAGTDSVGIAEAGRLPNLHEELRLLVEQAGVPPIAAITAATQNGARAIGIEATRGTIAVGKAADIVVLSADPTADIRHTRDIVYVFREGRRYAPLTSSP